MNKLLHSLLSSIGFILLGSGTSSGALAQDGNVEAGSKKVAMCIGCHGIEGYKTAFPAVYRVPMISGQYAKYIENALKAYAQGKRKHPSMVGIAGSLSDQDIADIAVFYEAQGKNRSSNTEDNAKPDAEDSNVKPSERAQALLQLGNCAACHGADFNTSLDPSYPKLAGQHEDALYYAMRSYFAGNQHPVWGRDHATMTATMQSLQSSLNVDARGLDDTLHETAEYFASLPGTLYTIPNPDFR